MISGLPANCLTEEAVDKDNKDLRESPETLASVRLAVGAEQAAALAEAQLQVASYIEEISLELRDMARAVQLDGLAYFIDMTRFEAAAHRRARERRLADDAAAR